MGVLTHLDMFHSAKTQRKTKKRLKQRFWTEIYQVCVGTEVLPGLCRDGDIPGLCRDGGVPGLCRDGDITGLCRDGGVPGLCRDGDIPGLCRDGGMTGLCRDGGITRSRKRLWVELVVVRSRE